MKPWEQDWGQSEPMAGNPWEMDWGGPTSEPEADGDAGVTVADVGKGLVRSLPEIGKSTLGGLAQYAGESQQESLGTAKAQLDRQVALESGLQGDRERFKGLGIEDSITEIGRQRGEVRPKYQENYERIKQGQGESRQRADIGRSMFEDANKKLDELRPDFAPGDWGKEFIYDVGMAAERMAPVLAVGLGTRNPLLTTAAMGPGVFGESFGHARKSGRTLSEATKDAIASTAIELGTELPVFGQLFKYGKPALKKILDTTVLEGVSESVSSLLQTAYDVGVVDDEMTLGEAFSSAQTYWDAAYEGAVGMGLGALMGGASVPGQLKAEKQAIEKIKDATANMQFEVMSDGAIDGMISQGEELGKLHGDKELDGHLDVLRAARDLRKNATNAADQIEREAVKPEQVPTTTLADVGLPSPNAGIGSIEQISQAGSIDEAIQASQNALASVSQQGLLGTPLSPESLVPSLGDTQARAFDTGDMTTPGYEPASYALDVQKGVQEDRTYQDIGQPQPEPWEVIYDEATLPVEPESQKVVERKARLSTTPANPAMARALEAAGLAKGLPTEPAKPQKPTRGQTMREISPEKDSLGTMIAKLGGLDKREATKHGIDPADMPKMRHGLLPGFTRPGSTKQGGIKGNTLDGLREYLNGNGFDFKDENQLLDAINSELRGDKQFTPAGYNYQSEQEAITRENDLKSYEESAQFDPFDKNYLGQISTPEIDLFTLPETMSGEEARVAAKFAQAVKVIGEDQADAMLERMAMQDLGTDEIISTFNTTIEETRNARKEEAGTGAGRIGVAQETKAEATAEATAGPQEVLTELETQSEADLVAKKTREQDQAIAAKEQADREVGLFDLQQQVDDTPPAPPADMFGSKIDQSANEAATSTQNEIPKPEVKSEGGLTDTLNRLADAEDAAAADWAGRKYKKNETKIELLGDGPVRDPDISIGRINEGRRRKAIESHEKNAAALRSIAKRDQDMLLMDYKELKRKTDAIPKEELGSLTREQMFETVISRSLLNLEDSYFGKGSAANAVRKSFSPIVQKEEAEAERYKNLTQEEKDDEWISFLKDIGLTPEEAEGSRTPAAKSPSENLAAEKKPTRKGKSLSWIKMPSETVEVAETGETAVIEETAEAAIGRVDSKLENLYQLMGCLKA